MRWAGLNHVPHNTCEEVRRDYHAVRSKECLRWSPSEEEKSIKCSILAYKAFIYLVLGAEGIEFHAVDGSEASSPVGGECKRHRSCRSDENNEIIIKLVTRRARQTEGLPCVR